MRRLVFVAAYLLSGPVFAQEVEKNYTAEMMLKLCEGSVAGESPEMQSMLCTFRMQSFIAEMIQNCPSIREGFAPLPPLTSDKPPSRGASRQAFKNYMQQNPDKWGLPWDAVVALATSETFPCTE